MSTVKKHLLITDGNEVCAKELSALLQKKYYECKVSIAKNAYETLSILKTEKVDMVIFDVNCVLECEVDTLSICKQLVTNIKLIALFSDENTKSLATYYDAGVKGFIKKTHAQQHIIEAIESVRVNANFFETTLLSVLLKEAESKPKVYSEIIKTKVLNSEELMLVQYIAEEHTNSEIANRLCMSKKALENRMHQLFIKLNVKSKIGIAAIAGRIGVYTPSI